MRQRRACWPSGRPMYRDSCCGCRRWTTSRCRLRCSCQIEVVPTWAECARSTYGTSSYGVPGVGGAVGTGRLLGSRGLSAGTRAGGASVHATVIDHEALDRAVLAEAARRRGERLAVERSAADLSRRLGEGTSSSSSPSTALMSVAEIRRQNAQRRASQQREAQRLFAQGAEAQSKGSLGAARIFYQMAHRRADAELKQRLAARLSQLGASAKSRATSR